MPVKISGKTYYRTTEVCLRVGIAKSTLFRWLREGIVNEVEYRDRKGWRLFAEHEIDRLKSEADRLSMSEEIPTRVS